MKKVGWLVAGVAVVIVIAVFFVQRFRIQPLPSLPEKQIHVQWPCPVSNPECTPTDTGRRAVLEGAGNTPPRVLLAPPHVDLDSVRQQLARDEAAALTRVSRSRQNVTRTFIVGWERHHGFFLVPINTSADNWPLVQEVWPDFRDDAIADKFARQARLAFGPTSTVSVHLGQRLICHCTGVPWRFGTKKLFLVRSAMLEWQEGQSIE
jgi:hypothetical protein